MRARRQFQPMVDALSYRIAPSGLIASPTLSQMSASQPAASTASGLTLSAYDTDMPETGTLGLIMAGPPPSTNSGTQLA